MNKRYAGLGLALMLISALLLAACQNKEPAKPKVPPLVAAGATPELAVSNALARIKSGDFNSLMQHVLPPPAYQQMRSQWQAESRLELATVTDAERQDFDRQMRKLAAPDAKQKLMQQLQPYLADYASKYKQQVPMAVGILRIMAETRITRADNLSAERKSQARGVVDAIANWALDTNWGDPAKAKQAVGIVVDSARALDLKSLDAAYQLDYTQAMQRYGTAWKGVKNLLAVYGLSVDAVLDSAKVTVLEQAGDKARVQVDYQILGKPLTTTVDMVRVGKRWYAAKVLDGWHKKQAELAAAASVTMPAAPATVAVP